MIPTQSFGFAGRCCLAFTLVCAGTACLPARPNTPAQVGGGTTAAKAGLPTAVRLVRQAQVGDRYAIQSSSQFTLLLRFEKDGAADETRFENNETRTRTSRVRTVTPEGNITVEDRTTQGKRTVINNGERDGTDLPPEAVLAVYQPDGRRVSRKPLRDPAATDPNAPDDQTQAADTPDDGLQTEPPLPAKSLHVGDTWSGAFPLLPKDFAARPDVTYTAKLTAIEMHQGAPCARVEYTLSATDKNLPPLLSKMLSERAKGLGMVKAEGTTTVYYTLDRGTVIDRNASLTITMQFNLTEPDPATDQMDIHRVVRATIKSLGSEKATRFPTYAPALVPSPVAGN